MEHTVYVSRSALAAALHFAADKDVRYYLNGVALEYGPTITIHAATNGHIAFAHPETRDRDDPNIGTGAAIIGRDDVKRILRDWKAKLNKHIGVLPFTFHDAEHPAAGPWQCAALGLSGMLIDGKFPDWRRIVPTYADDTDRSAAQFDTRYLAAIQKAFGELGNKTGMFEILHRGPNASALCVSPNSPSTVAVIMPWRMDGTVFAHEWTAADVAADFPPLKPPAEGTAEADGFKVETIAA